MTSNLKTKTVTEYSEHHFNFWFQKKHPVIICVSTEISGTEPTSQEAFQCSLSSYIHTEWAATPTL